MAFVANNLNVTKGHGLAVLDAAGDRLAVTKGHGLAVLDSTNSVSVSKGHGLVVLDTREDGVTLTKAYAGVLLADTDEETEVPAAPVTGRGVGLAGRIGFTNVRFR